MYLKAFALFILIASGIDSLGQTYQKRLALVIGNSAYQNGGSLKNPVNDVRSVSSALQTMGFEVLRYENVTQAQMKQAINAFGVKLRGYEVGLFYYAGHGIQHKGTNYMIPVEADLQAAEQIEFDCVAADRILAYMESASTKVNILIMDACRNNPFERSWNRSANGGGLAMMNAPTGTLIAYATAPGKVASDGESANGLYTSMLLKYMKDPTLNLEQVFKKVRTEVTEKSSGAQVPWETTSLTGEDFFLTAKPSGNSIQNQSDKQVVNDSKVSREIGGGGEDSEKALQYYTQAQEKYDKALYEEAIGLYSKAIEFNPNDYSSYLWRGHSYYGLGFLDGVINAKFLDGAIADYTKTIELSPGESEAYFYRASSKKLLDKKNEAITDFSLSIKYNRKNKDAFYWRGMTYYSLEKYDAAIEDFAAALAIDAFYTQGYYWRGSSYFALEDYTQALTDFNKTIEVDPTYADAYLYKGHVYYNQADYKSATMIYDEALKVKPTLIEAALFRAHCNFNLAEYQNALTNYVKVLDIDPKYADAYYWRSKVYLAMEEKGSAEKEIKKALSLAPSNETYLTYFNENFK